MSCPRYRSVTIAGSDWYLLSDALIPAAAVEAIRSARPESPAGDDRAVVDLADGREILAHFFRPHDRPHDRADVLMGFRILPGVSGEVEFADGVAELRDLAAMLRDGDRVLCYPRDSAAPAERYRACPYPWEARTG